MKNKLIDLNNHLFAQIERLGDEDLNPEELTQEIKRSKAMAKVSAQIINNGRLALDAVTLQAKYGNSNTLPEMIEHKKNA